MKLKEGYILVEVLISSFIITIIMGCLYSIIVTSNDAKTNIEDRIELSQQSEEIEYQIKDLIEGCTNIINITTVDKIVINNLEYGNSYNVSSIKVNLKNDQNKNDLSLKNKEISLKEDKRKLFINTLNKNNSSESGGYEIGDYVKSICIKLENPKLVSIVLNLEKNDIVLKREIKLYMRCDVS